MAEPFLGQISIVGFDFAPRGWAFCDGRSMSIVQNPTLYSLLGTIYGGDDKKTFNLPDMRGKVPIGISKDYPAGNTGGVDQARVSLSEMPAHTHKFYGVDVPGTRSGPQLNKQNLLANSGSRDFYDTSAESTSFLKPDSISKIGESVSHKNIQPSLALNFIIALDGTYPTKSN
jgi:microcystin-dependent protein